MSAGGWWALLAGVIAAALGLGAGWWLARFPHVRHVWEPVSVQPRRRLGVAAAFEASSPATVVLWHCVRCPETTSTFLDGTWTLAEVRGVAPEPEPGSLQRAQLVDDDDEQPAAAISAAEDLSP